MMPRTWRQSILLPTLLPQSGSALRASAQICFFDMLVVIVVVVVVAAVPLELGGAAAWARSESEQMFAFCAEI